MVHTTLLFLNIGSSEMILIMAVALLLFGGEKLPELARGLGKGIRDFKEASEDVKRELNNQINNFEEKKAEDKALEAASLPPEPGVPNTIPSIESYMANDELPHAEVDLTTTTPTEAALHTPAEISHAAEHAQPVVETVEHAENAVAGTVAEHNGFGSAATFHPVNHDDHTEHPATPTTENK